MCVNNSAAIWLSERLFGRLFDRDRALRAVDDDNRLVLRLAADLEGVEAAELQERPEVAADVAVDRDAGHRRERDHDRLAGAGVLRIARDRSGADDEGVVGVVPLRLRRDRLPQIVEAEPAPARKDVDHLFGDRLLLHRHRVEVDEQRAAGVTLVWQAGRKRHFKEHLVGRAQLRDVIRIRRPDFGIVGNRHDRLLRSAGPASEPVYGGPNGPRERAVKPRPVYQKEPAGPAGGPDRAGALPRRLQFQEAGHRMARCCQEEP